MTNLLSNASGSGRPEPNIYGNFDCFECREPVDAAYHDKKNNMLRYWCSQDHESVIEEFGL